MELPACNADIFANGKPFLAADTYKCGAIKFEEWVKLLTQESNQRLDWHYSGGIASVLFIGDRQKIKEAVDKNPCPAKILKFYEEKDKGLYRAGVTSVPENAIAGFFRWWIRIMFYIER